MIERTVALTEIRQALRRSRVVALVGPRQCGKTTLASQLDYWRTQQGAELDLLLFKHGRRFGIEVKRADAPGMTRSMRISQSDLRLDHLTVIYPGPTRYELTERISVVPFSDLARGELDLIPPSRGRDNRRPTSR